MKKVLIFSILALLVFSIQSPCKAQDNSSLTVIDFSWSRYHQALNLEPTWDSAPTPARPPMSDADRKIVERRYGDLMRSADLRKVERDAARSKVRPGEGYTYKVKVQNTDAKTIKMIYWEYQIKELASPDNLTRRQFLCRMTIKTNEKKGLEAFSSAAPTNVISAKTLEKDSRKLFEDNVVINRIEYADGSIWQRADWVFPEGRTTYPTDLPPMARRSACRSF